MHCSRVYGNDYASHYVASVVYVQEGVSVVADKLFKGDLYLDFVPVLVLQSSRSG